MPLDTATDNVLIAYAGLVRIFGQRLKDRFPNLTADETIALAQLLARDAITALVK